MMLGNVEQDTRYQCLLLALRQAENQAEPTSVTELIENSELLSQYVLEGKSQ